MEDLFYDANLRFSTEIIDLSDDLKNASLSEVSKSLIDKDGFIHPVKVIFKSSDGKILKNASTFNESNLSPININLTDLQLFEETFTDEETNISGKAKATISDGFLKIDPKFKFEFKYEPPRIEKWIWYPGYLDKFKFYADNTLIDIKSIFTLESEVKYSYEAKKILKDDAVLASYIFIVGCIPVIIDIEIDLICNFNIELGGNCNISRGFRSTNHVTVGAKYEHEDQNWQLIKKIDKSNTHFGDNKGSAGADFGFDIGPEMRIKFYRILGPIIYVGPLLEGEINISSEFNWDQRLDLGVTAEVGGEVKIFGKELIPIPKYEWDFYKTNLWSAPYKLDLVSGDNQSAFCGNMLPHPIIVKVTDKLDKSLPLVQVHFVPSAGSVTQNVVTTDKDGVASISWILPQDVGNHTLKAYLLNGNDIEIEGCALTINAEALQKTDNIFIDERDGKIYKTVTIGDQTWMAENLAYLPLVSPQEIWSYKEPTYFVYDYKGTSVSVAKATDNYGTYGVLYNWPAAKDACPAGWHLSTDEEWTKLEKYLVDNGFNYDGTTSENKIAKSLASQRTWNLSTEEGAIGNNLSLNNKSGFSALAGGQYDEGFHSLSQRGAWWSSEFNENSAWFRILDYEYSALGGDTHSKVLSFSVRCVKD
jgi:uncharacterized protein (TIGR02145 family)